MKTKKDQEYSFNHFVKRMKERHGFNIDRAEYNALCSLIKNKEPINIEKQKNDIQLTFDLFFYSTYMKVIWSNSRQCLTTVLPKGS
jgi:hypothetical protein